MVPASKGEVTQLEAISPIFDQFTASVPTATNAKPTIAPTIEWVVETGQPTRDATVNHMAAANRAESMPYSRMLASPIAPESIIPLRIVEVTSPPARKAPRNSKIAAIMIACLTVIALEPTDVAIAFATSLAPMPQAM